MKEITWFIEDSEIEQFALTQITNGKSVDINDFKGKHTIHASNLLDKWQVLNIHRHGRYKDIHLHNHDYFELEFVLKGKITTIVDGYSMTLKSGDLLLLNTNCFHEFKSANNEDTLLNIIIHKNFVDQMLSIFNEKTPILNFIKNSIYIPNKIDTNYLYYNTANNDAIKNGLIKFITNFNPSNELDSGLIKVQFFRLLVELGKYTPEQLNQFKYDYNADLIIKSYKYINDNLADANLNTIADHLHTTNYTLSRIFKQKTGTTFIKEVQRIRFSKAYDLIITTNIPINDIASLIGYDNQTFFYRKFKQLYNQTPNQLRITYLNKKTSN